MTVTPMEDLLRDVPLPVEPRPGANGLAGNCRACQGRTSGHGDLMCLTCWQALPKSLIALFRMVWRLVHAGLVPEAARLELDRMLVREAQERRKLAVTPMRVASSIEPATQVTKAPTPIQLRQAAAKTSLATNGAPRKAARENGRGESPVTTKMRAALPMRETEAITAGELSDRTRHDRHLTAVWCDYNRKQGLSWLRSKNLAKPGSKIGSWLYWRVA